jgi:peptide/nickel transport system substrate-binding protein
MLAAATATSKRAGETGIDHNLWLPALALGASRRNLDIPADARLFFRQQRKSNDMGRMMMSAPRFKPELATWTMRCIAAALFTVAGASLAAAADPGKPIDELVIGSITDVSVPDPDIVGVQQFIFTDNVFDTLIRYTDSTKPEPALATSWSWNADKTALTLKLRQGVKFHSGAEFTAEDVKFTFARVLDPALGVAQARTMASWIKETETPDKYTVVLKFDRPRANFIDVLSFLYIADQSVLAKGNPAKDVSGTGPYRMTEWRPGEQMVLEKNAAYWAEVKGPKRIVIKKIGDPQSIAGQLRAGAVKVAWGLTERDLVPFSKDKNYTLVRNDFGPEFYYLGINVTKPPFTDPRVRQAFVWALNRDRFVRSTLQGFGEVTASPWPPHSPVYEKATREAYTFNLDKAKALLKEAGINSLDVTMLSSNAWPPLAEQAQQYQADLAKIGVKLTIDTVDVTRWIQDVTASHEHAIWTGAFGFSIYSPESLFAMAAPWRTQGNMTQFESPEFTRLADAAGGEPDDAKRLAILKQITRYSQEQAFTNPIARRVLAMVEAKGIKGAKFRVTGFMSFQDVVGD